jgi:GT2 family glycosyltransferase
MRVWICIPVFNRIEFTLKCLASIKDQTFKEFCVVLCDHGSSDGTAVRVSNEYPEVILINADSSLWWTGAMNRCVEYVLEHSSKGDYILTLNNDTELPENYLDSLTNNAIKYPNSILTSVILDVRTSKIVTVGYRQNWLIAQSKAVTFEQDHLPGDENIAEVTHASGRGTLFPIEVFQNLGLFDEKHLPHYGADYDFSHKARNSGFPVYVCRDCGVLSHVDATGMTKVRNQFSLKSLFNYLFSIRSPANIRVRWWYGWNNCPKLLFPSFIFLDMLRIIGSYFKFFFRSDGKSP